MSDQPKCSACGGTEHLRKGSFWHDAPICKPCFFVWYDCIPMDDSSDPAKVGAESMRLKAAGKYPWIGEYAPKACLDERA